MADDWRTPLVRDLAAKASAIGLNRADRAAVVRLIHELAVAEERLPVEQRIGYLRAVDSYGPKGLSQLHTLAKKFWPVSVPSYGDRSVAAEPVAVADPEPPTPEVVPVEIEEFEVCYQIQLDQAYSPEGVLERVEQFVGGHIRDRSFQADAILQRDVEYDLLCRQTCPVPEVTELLLSIPWVQDVLSKPVSLHGRRL